MRRICLGTARSPTPISRRLWSMSRQKASNRALAEIAAALRLAAGQPPHNSTDAARSCRSAPRPCPARRKLDKSRQARLCHDHAIERVMVRAWIWRRNNRKSSDSRCPSAVRADPGPVVFLTSRGRSEAVGGKEGGDERGSVNAAPDSPAGLVAGAACRRRSPAAGRLSSRDLSARLYGARGRARANPARRLAGAGSDRARHALDGGDTQRRGVLLHLAALRADSFLPQKVIDQRVVAVYFDKDRRVQRLANYGLKDGKVFDFVSRTTPSGGRRKLSQPTSSRSPILVAASAYRSPLDLRRLCLGAHRSRELAESMLRCKRGEAV